MMVNLFDVLVCVCITGGGRHSPHTSEEKDQKRGNLPKGAWSLCPLSMRVRS